MPVGGGLYGFIKHLDRYKNFDEDTQTVFYSLKTRGFYLQTKYHFGIDIKYMEIIFKIDTIFSHRLGSTQCVFPIISVHVFTTFELDSFLECIHGVHTFTGVHMIAEVSYIHRVHMNAYDIAGMHTFDGVHVYTEFLYTPSSYRT